MKTIKQIILGLVVLLTCTATAQTGFNYKALIKDASGNIVSNQEIHIRFTIQTLTGPTFISSYQERHNATTDVNGIVIVTIGEGDDNIVGDFPSNFWLPNITLNTEIDIERDGTYVDFGTSNFKKVPMAIKADHSDTADIATVALTANNVTTKIDDLSDAKSDDNGSSLFIGVNAGSNDDGTDNDNVGIGNYALNRNTTGENNVAIGAYSLYVNTEGKRNTAIGRDALRINSTGNYNTAIGNSALRDNSIGNYNTAIGRLALRLNTGADNTAIGSLALGHTTTGEKNVAIGKDAGLSNITGSGNIYIGNETGWTNGLSESNKLYIDNTQTGSPLIYGQFDTNLIRINGTLDVTEEINRSATGDANMIPLAYGGIDGGANPSIIGGTGNYTVSRDNTTNVYTISVVGETLSINNTVASVVANTQNFRTVNVTYSGGNMLVHIFLINGTKVASPFQFTIHKL